MKCSILTHQIWLLVTSRSDNGSWVYCEFRKGIVSIGWKMYRLIVHDIPYAAHFVVGVLFKENMYFHLDRSDRWWVTAWFWKHFTCYISSLKGFWVHPIIRFTMERLLEQWPFDFCEVLVSKDRMLNVVGLDDLQFSN